MHVFLAIISEGFVACKILLRCVKLLNQESHKSMRCWISFPQTKIAPSFLQFKSCFCISADMSVSLVQFCSVRRSVCLLLFFFWGVVMCIIVVTQRHPKAENSNLSGLAWCILPCIWRTRSVSVFSDFQKGVPRRVFWWSILRCQWFPCTKESLKF